MSDVPPQPNDDEQALIDRVGSTPPEELIGEMREDLELLASVAAADVVPQFRAWFSSEEFEVASLLGTGRGDPLLGVEWTFTGRHDKGQNFRGLQSTGTEVVVRGCTVFEGERGQLLVRRYIDWIGLYAQLGLGIHWRLPVEVVEEGS